LQRDNREELTEAPEVQLSNSQAGRSGLPGRVRHRQERAKTPLVAVYNHYKRIQSARTRTTRSSSRSQHHARRATGCGKTCWRRPWRGCLTCRSPSRRDQPHERGTWARTWRNPAQADPGADLDVKKAETGIIYITRSTRSRARARAEHHPRRVGRGRAAGIAEILEGRWRASRRRAAGSTRTRSSSR